MKKLPGPLGGGSSMERRSHELCVGVKVVQWCSEVLLNFHHRWRTEEKSLTPQREKPILIPTSGRVSEELGEK